VQRRSITDGVGRESPRVDPSTAWVRAILVIALVAVLFIAIVVDGFGIVDIVLVIILLLAGPGSILYGLRLSAAEHAERPDSSQEGYLGLWIAHHLPLRLARAWWVIFGLGWCVFLVLVLWRNAT
jgi:hypothetical protein